MEGEVNNNIVINWNNIVGQEARSMDNADLGKVQGLFEPFIVTERGTINKEKFYIPKSLIRRYTDEILFFDMTEQQAKDYCMRTTPPSEYEEKGIVQIISERRKSSEEEEKENQNEQDETKIVTVREEKKELESETKLLEKIPLATTLSKVNINEEEIANKLKDAVNEFKDLIISGTKLAKQKIKQTQEILEEKQAKRDTEKIAKMGSLASQFTNSFDDILSEIKAKTYEEQEQIYTGFIKLIEQQRDLVIARRDLAGKLKDSIRKPVIDTATMEKVPPLEQKIRREPELPSAQDPQLPEIVSATSAAEDESKIEPQIITAAEEEEPPEQITASTANTESQIKKQKINRSEPSKTSAKSKSSKVKKKTR